MKWTIALILLGALILVLFLTNPKEQMHVDKVKFKAEKLIKTSLREDMSKESDEDGWESLSKGLVYMFLDKFIDEGVEAMVSSDNYFLFSLTEVTYEEDEHIVGLGILNNVFISEKFDEKIKSLMSDFNDRNSSESPSNGLSSTFENACPNS